MKTKFFFFFALFFSIIISLQANTPNWGATGHRTVGEIAEKHLSKKTKKALYKLLNGQSLAFVSTFADEDRKSVV